MPFTLHFHRRPACAGGNHDPSCAPLGDEEACFEFKKELAGWCICTHYKPEEGLARADLGKISPVTISLTK